MLFIHIYEVTGSTLFSKLFADKVFPISSNFGYFALVPPIGHNKKNLQVAYLEMYMRQVALNALYMHLKASAVAQTALKTKLTC